jgi:hypothetical protein
VLLGMVLAVPAAALISCGGSPTPTGPAAQQQAAVDSQVSDATSPGDVATTADGGARPGGPDPGAATGGGARPGGPFDVEAFENRGEALADFRPFGAEHCAGGRCTLVERTSTDPDAQEGCEIADFTYDPPARPAGAPPAEQFIQRGTTVTVLVHCPPEAGKSGAAVPSSDGSGDSAASPESDAATDSPSDGTGG